MSDNNEQFEDELDPDTDIDTNEGADGTALDATQMLPLLHAALDSIRVGKLTRPPREVKARKHKVALVVKANLMQYVRACVDDIGAGILRSLVESPSPVFPLNTAARFSSQVRKPIPSAARATALYSA